MGALRRTFPIVIVLFSCAGTAEPILTAPVSTVSETESTSAEETTTSIAATTSIEATTTTEAGVVATDFQVPFRIETGELIPRYSLGNGYLEFSAGEGRVLMFTTAGRGTTAEWVDYLTTDPRLTSTDSRAIEIGGLPTTMLDVRLSGPEFPLFTYSDTDPGTPDAQWVVHEGRLNRFFITEVSGEAVTIVAEAPEDEAVEFFAEVDALLADLEWTAAG